MSLLKGDKSIKPKVMMPSPTLTIKDGWNFGLGFWLALIIGLPVILLILTIIFYVGIFLIGSL